MTDYSSRISTVLESTFGFPSFRPLQEDIVQAILRGEDVFALMPTGGGKSLCYQLPALLLDGATVVVSPLIALMKDQVDALRALGVPATFINSSLENSEIERRQGMVARGDVRLLYVAPERLMMPGFLRLLGSARVKLFAIDEAHCISEWGHDFRPEYRELRQLRTIFPGVPLSAFTATATTRVQRDIVAQLRLEGAARFRGSFNRPNLYYEVRPKRGMYAELVSYLRQHRDMSGIIYCGSRAGTEELVRKLSLDGIRSVAYHAGLESEDRRRRQEAFIRDDTRIIVATIAFGMGIDKPDVRFVVHVDLPKTLENYYQESGRAGRDGEPSDCILFYSRSDLIKLRHFAEEKPSAEERRIALQQLHQMADWAESTSCRRRALLSYFDEDLAAQDDPCCDVCSNPASQEDMTIPAQMFLSCVKRTRERFGATHVINVLRGSRAQRVLDFGHDKLSTYGIGSDRSDEEWRHISHELIRGGFLLQDADAFNVLRVTERGHEVLFSGAQVRLTVPRRTARNGRHADAGAHGPLFDRLRALRKTLADRQGIPPYVIFHDSTLRQMAACLPADREQLVQVSGVGEHKARRFGDDFLAVIHEYVAETGAEPQAPTPPPAPTPRPRLRGETGSSVWETVRLFQDGLHVSEIAEARGISHTTVEGHLAEAMEAGQRLDIDRLVTPAKRRAIEAALERVGRDRLKPIMEHLGDGYTYGELRLVRAATDVVSARQKEDEP